MGGDSDDDESMGIDTSRSLSQDYVQCEIDRWDKFDDINSFLGNEDSLLDYFALFTVHSVSYPLMFGLFQSIAGCLGVEANSERVFSCSGRISDPSMKPKTLSKYSFIAFNSHLEPSMKEIKEAYTQAYKSLTPTEEVSNNHVG